ncbi:hypothetical protein K502DRAFT_273697, partial [Neoconidiobolus thromboides FSU 785]
IGSTFSISTLSQTLGVLPPARAVDEYEISLKYKDLWMLNLGLLKHPLCSKMAYKITLIITAPCYNFERVSNWSTSFHRHDIKIEESKE